MSAFKKVTPCPEPVDGNRLLFDLTEWLLEYVYIEGHEAHAVALWSVLTWFIEEVHFAPILAVLSPTKRCGKTTLFDLLGRIVRSPISTSVIGTTSATLFRLNEELKPTFLIDEAERLNENGDIVGLLNAGYRRGGSVQRCRQLGSGGYAVDDFDAFGFRALAAIGNLWDTLLDRSILVRMQRKPKGVEKRRFNPEAVEKRGSELASMTARFTADHVGNFVRAAEEVEIPASLNDREGDNWIGLLAVAHLAGGDWPDRARNASIDLSEDSGGHADRGESLIRDIYSVFENEKWVKALPSGRLVDKLNAIEESPWGDSQGGKGLSTHKLASMLKPFGIGSKQARLGGEKFRGYWLETLRPAFDRYPPGVGQLGQSKADANSERPTSEEQTGTEVGHQKPNVFNGCPTCPTLEEEGANAPPLISPR